MKDSENPIRIAGEFYMVLDPDMDCKDYININNPRARDQVLNLMIECNLIDSWRELNLEARQYTWRRKDTTKQARLDFFSISESIFMDVISAKILPGYRTDHSKLLSNLILVNLKKVNHIGNLIIHCLKTKSM